MGPTSPTTATLSQVSGMDCRIWPPAVANPYNDEEAVGTMDQLNNDTGPKHRATGYLSGDLGNWISQVSWEWPLGSAANTAAGYAY